MKLLYIQCMKYLNAGIRRTEAVLLVDTGNVFNSLSDKPYLTTLNTIVYHQLHRWAITLIFNPDYLYFRDKKIRSIDNYVIGIAPLLNLLVLSHAEKNPRLVAFADDLTYAGSIEKFVVVGRKFWKLTQVSDIFQNQQRQY